MNIPEYDRWFAELRQAVLDYNDTKVDPQDPTRYNQSAYRLKKEHRKDISEAYYSKIDEDRFSEYKRYSRCKTCKKFIWELGDLVVLDRQGNLDWVIWPDPSAISKDNPHHAFLVYMKLLKSSGELRVEQPLTKLSIEARSFMKDPPMDQYGTTAEDGSRYQHFLIQYRSGLVAPITEAAVSRIRSISVSRSARGKAILYDNLAPSDGATPSGTETQDQLHNQKVREETQSAIAENTTGPDDGLEMTLRDWFLAAMRGGRYKHKYWLLRCFSLTTGISSRPREDQPWDIHHWPHENAAELVPGSITFLDGDKKPVKITDWSYSTKRPAPPLHLSKGVDLLPGDVTNLSEKVRTTYGNIVANYLALIYPFGSNLPFKVGRFSLKDVEKDIEHRLVSNPPEDEPKEPGKIYVSDYMKFTRGAGMLAGLSQLCVPSATPKSMTTHPEMGKRKKELLEKYKDQLDDPVIVAKIEKELIALDTEHLKGDAANGFLLGGKSRNVIRKKSYGMMGLNTAFNEDGKGELLSRSLEEGMELEDIPALASDIREGSYDRGAETALGGDEVKKMLSITQNSVIEDDDCGTDLTFPYVVTSGNKGLLVDTYHIRRGKKELLTTENLDQYVGSTLQLRSPYFCRQGKSNICKTCIGERYASRPTSLPSAVSAVGSTFMGIFMASMHAKELQTAVYDPKLHII